jgi:hypothetical protein
MEHILKTWGNTIRFIIVLFVLYYGASIIVNKFVNNTEFSIDFNNDKTLVTLIDKKNVIANSVLPACDCWIRTGIEIRPGEEYEIKVSGKVHTTADKMIMDAADNIKPRFQWIDPEGASMKIRGKDYEISDNIRKTLLLAQNANLGAVLFYFQKGNTKQPDCNLGSGFYIPNEDSVIIYKREGLTGKNNEKETWYIWATVNDMLIRDFQSKDNRLAYLGGSKQDYTLKESRWDTLKKENYNRIWFDDNFGHFVVSAKISKPVPFLEFW